jgi:glycosyltransferase involved in cell wall biosynthesis
LWLPLRELAAARPHLLVCGYDRASPALTSVFAHMFSDRVAFRTLPFYESWTPRTLWRQLALNVLFRLVDGAKVPGRAGREMAGSYGLPDARTWPVTQSIDVPRYSAAREFPAGEREAMRRRLGLRGTTFLYVGRLWSGKGVDTLLDAFRTVRSGAECSLLIVGDGVDEARFRAQAAGIPDVAFAGFVQPADMIPYYAAADVLVFPTLGDPHGLVVEEALAAGLPVISSDAAGDIRERIGTMGLVVPAGDRARLAEAMARALKRYELAALTAAVREKDPTVYAHDRWVEDFEAFVAGILALPRRVPLDAAFAGR